MSVTNASSNATSSSNPRAARLIQQAKSSHSVKRESQSPVGSTEKRLKLVIKSQQQSASENPPKANDIKLNLKVIRDEMARKT